MNQLKLCVAGASVLAALVLALVVLPSSVVGSNEYIFLPDRAHPVAPLVTFPGSHDPTKGGPPRSYDRLRVKARLFCDFRLRN